MFLLLSDCDARVLTAIFFFSTVHNIWLSGTNSVITGVSFL